MRSLLKINLFCCIVAAVFILSCKKKNTTTTSDDPTKTEFDRKAMLTNIGSTIIVPAYQSLSLAATRLDSAVSDFNTSPTSTKLLSLQTVFKTTYRVWQSASSFDFGPADNHLLSKNTNTFPTDTTAVNANINSGNYNLNSLTSLDYKGLPALDYLLFGIGADNTSILSKYTTDSKAANRKQYLSVLASGIKTNAAAVVSEWASYMTTFVNATGTDVGSSLGQLINEVDEDLEVLKNYKIGIPLGKQSMGTLYPTKVEAYYCGISTELALLQLKSIQNIYLGKSGNTDGLGLDDHLAAINAQSTNGTLNDAIKNQFTAAISKLQVVQDPLSGAIVNNQATVNAAYVEIQKLVVLLKTDMSSALGVLITYEDNDGD